MLLTDETLARRVFETNDFGKKNSLQKKIDQKQFSQEGNFYKKLDTLLPYSGWLVLKIK